MTSMDSLVNRLSGHLRTGVCRPWASTNDTSSSAQIFKTVHGALRRSLDSSLAVVSHPTLCEDVLITHGPLCRLISHNQSPLKPFKDVFNTFFLALVVAGTNVRVNISTEAITGSLFADDKVAEMNTASDIVTPPTPTSTMDIIDFSAVLDKAISSQNHGSMDESTHDEDCETYATDYDIDTQSASRSSSTCSKYTAGTSDSDSSPTTASLNTEYDEDSAEKSVYWTVDELHGVSSDLERCLSQNKENEAPEETDETAPNNQLVKYHDPRQDFGITKSTPWPQQIDYGKFAKFTGLVCNYPPIRSREYEMDDLHCNSSSLANLIANDPFDSLDPPFAIYQNGHWEMLHTKWGVMDSFVCYWDASIEEFAEEWQIVEQYHFLPRKFGDIRNMDHHYEKQAFVIANNGSVYWMMNNERFKKFWYEELKVFYRWYRDDRCSVIYEEANDYATITQETNDVQIHGAIFGYPAIFFTRCSDGYRESIRDTEMWLARSQDKATGGQGSSENHSNLQRFVELDDGDVSLEIEEICEDESQANKFPSQYSSQDNLTVGINDEYQHDGQLVLYSDNNEHQHDGQLVLYNQHNEHENQAPEYDKEYGYKYCTYEYMYEEWPQLTYTRLEETKWASHSWIDQNGHMYLVGMADDNDSIQRGERLAMNSPSWVLLTRPDLQGKATWNGQPGPEIMLTDPDGEEFWPEDSRDDAQVLNVSEYSHAKEENLVQSPPSPSEDTLTTFSDATKPINVDYTIIAEALDCGDASVEDDGYTLEIVRQIDDHGFLLEMPHSLDSKSRKSSTSSFESMSTDSDSENLSSLGSPSTHYEEMDAVSTIDHLDEPCQKKDLCPANAEYEASTMRHLASSTIETSSETSSECCTSSCMAEKQKELLPTPLAPANDIISTESFGNENAELSRENSDLKAVDANTCAENQLSADTLVTSIKARHPEAPVVVSSSAFITMKALRSSQAPVVVSSCDYLARKTIRPSKAPMVEPSPLLDTPVEHESAQSFPGYPDNSNSENGRQMCQNMEEGSSAPEIAGPNSDDGTVYSDSESNEEDDEPERLTWTYLECTEWASHSWIDQNGDLYVLRDLKDAATRAAGSRLQGPGSGWTLLPQPNLLRQTTSEENSDPVLMLTTPEGDEMWPEDMTYYPGQTSWADLVGDDDWN
ncbi:hypothetical protein B0T17DRAFT_506804 [Bombardia bombarda]|uniref:Uncharacterized protein n=1 Tax=Bombardia bombarda TaxID=252184 RepID=A0AA39XAU9_9PEZI|nr:hypothetical protein B0T17DRAFT_506804 [Bombardia bombarda]